MYAVIQTGGKQYKVSPGDRIRVELVRDAELTMTPLLVVAGDTVTLSGSELSGMPVVARHVEDGRGVKIRAGKYKNKSRYRRRWGHRQDYSLIEIASIGNVTAADLAPPPVEDGVVADEEELAAESDVEATDHDEPGDIRVDGDNDDTLEDDDPADGVDTEENEG